MSSITAANAILMLSISNLFPAAQRLQQFSADDVYGVDPVAVSEPSMGVDGILTAGLVYNPKTQHITLQADSPSNAIFDTWNNKQLNAQDIFWADMVVTLISLGVKYTHSRGTLTTFPPMPNAQKVLRPRQFTITWQSILPSPV